MPKFVRKGTDVDVEAFQLTAENVHEVSAWANDAQIVTEHDALDHDKTFVGLNVDTWSGMERCSEGDFVVKDLIGEFHVRKQGSFLAHFDEK